MTIHEPKPDDTGICNSTNPDFWRSINTPNGVSGEIEKLNSLVALKYEKLPFYLRDIVYGGLQQMRLLNVMHSAFCKPTAGVEAQGDKLYYSGRKSLEDGTIPSEIQAFQDSNTVRLLINECEIDPLNLDVLDKPEARDLVETALVMLLDTSSKSVIDDSGVIDPCAPDSDDSIIELANSLNASVDLAIAMGDEFVIRRIQKAIHINLGKVIKQLNPRFSESSANAITNKARSIVLNIQEVLINQDIKDNKKNNIQKLINDKKHGNQAKLQAFYTILYSAANQRLVDYLNLQQPLAKQIATQTVRNKLQTSGLARVLAEDRLSEIKTCQPKCANDVLNQVEYIDFEPLHEGETLREQAIDIKKEVSARGGNTPRKFDLDRLDVLAVLAKHFSDEGYEFKFYRHKPKPKTEKESEAKDDTPDANSDSNNFSYDGQRFDEYVIMELYKTMQNGEIDRIIVAESPVENNAGFLYRESIQADWEDRVTPWREVMSQTKGYALSYGGVFKQLHKKKAGMSVVESIAERTKEKIKWSREKYLAEKYRNRAAEFAVRMARDS